jgi:hypothetical protein
MASFRSEASTARAWLYLGRVSFSEPKNSTPREEIYATLEFVRFDDTCGITDTESLIARHIMAIIIANPAPESHKFQERRGLDTKTFGLTSQHIMSAALLPEGHSVRWLVAAAVEGYLRHEYDKFLRRLKKVLTFQSDLLMAAKATFKMVTSVYVITCEDPISVLSLQLSVADQRCPFREGTIVYLAEAVRCSGLRLLYNTACVSAIVIYSTFLYCGFGISDLEVRLGVSKALIFGVFVGPYLDSEFFITTSS